jgi:hypothetical protein
VPSGEKLSALILLFSGCPQVLTGEPLKADQMQTELSSVAAMSLVPFGSRETAVLLSGTGRTLPPRVLASQATTSPDAEPV